MCGLRGKLFIDMFADDISCYKYYLHVLSLLLFITLQTGLGSSEGRVSAPRSGGTGFDPGPRHTKVVNNGTSCSPLGTRIFGVGLGLAAPVSV